jgi:hypothetical protein
MDDAEREAWRDNHQNALNVAHDPRACRINSSGLTPAQGMAARCSAQVAATAPRLAARFPGHLASQSSF